MLYVAMRVIYVSFYYYMMPYLIIFVSMYNGLSQVLNK